MTQDYDPREEDALSHRDEVITAHKRTSSIPGLLSWSLVFLACVDEGAAVGITLAVTPDPDGGELTYTITSQPSNGTLSGVEPNLTYTHNGSLQSGKSLVRIPTQQYY